VYNGTNAFVVKPACERRRQCLQPNHLKIACPMHYKYMRQSTKSIMKGYNLG
jgi:hypothetical protein